MHWLIALLVFLLVTGLSVSVDARSIVIPNIEIIVERVSDISGLPVAPPPKEIREVPISTIYAYTKKRYARATYLCIVKQLLFAPSYDYLVPHELTHMLQCVARIDPTGPDSERQAARVQQVYYQMWPKAWPN